MLNNDIVDRFVAVKGSSYGRIAIEKAKILVTKSSMCVAPSNQIFEYFVRNFRKLRQLPFIAHSIMWLSLIYGKAKQLMCEWSSILGLAPLSLVFKRFDIKKCSQSLIASFHMAVVKYQRLDLLRVDSMTLKSFNRKNFGN